MPLAQNSGGRKAGDAASPRTQHPANRSS
jgi:hypothetical protein